jgi:hypothetical protein
MLTEISGNIQTHSTCVRVPIFSKYSRGGRVCAKLASNDNLMMGLNVPGNFSTKKGKHEFANLYTFR